MKNELPSIFMGILALDAFFVCLATLLKLFGVLSLPWWAILSPAWLPLAGAWLFTLMCVCVVGAISVLEERR